MNLTHLLSALGLVLLGAVIGATVLARLWLRRMRDPKAVGEFIRQLYAMSHPHWLQRTQNDNTPVCPCCGWSEDAGHAARRAEETDDG